MKDITIDDITTGTIDGSGIYDRLMQINSLHLLREFKEQRITGDKYAEAYIAMMVESMKTSASFAVASISANNQRELTEEERQKLIAETENIKATTKNIGVQTDLVHKQITLTDKQITKLDADIRISDEQGKLIAAQVITEKAQTTTPTAGIKYAEYTKLMREDEIAEATKQLAIQKVLTEKAQVMDKIPELSGFTDSVGTVEGMIGVQKDVHIEQAEGFKQANIHKATKLMTDIWAIQRSTDPGTIPTAATQLHDNNIGSAVETMFNGLGMTIKPPPTR